MVKACEEGKYVRIYVTGKCVGKWSMLCIIGTNAYIQPHPTNDRCLCCLIGNGICFHFGNQITFRGWLEITRSRKLLSGTERMGVKIWRTWMYLGPADWKWCAQTEPTYMLSGTAYLYIIYGKIISPARNPGHYILIRAFDSKYQSLRKQHTLSCSLHFLAWFKNLQCWWFIDCSNISNPNGFLTNMDSPHVPYMGNHYA